MLIHPACLPRSSMKAAAFYRLRGARGAASRSFASVTSNTEVVCGLLAYRWHRPLKLLDRGISLFTPSKLNSPTRYVLRAIGFEWACAESAVEHLETDNFESGPETTDGSNIKLKLPCALPAGPYSTDKLRPGVLVRYSLPAWYAESVRHESPFRMGVLLSATQKECKILQISAEDLGMYTAGPFTQYQQSAESALTVPRDLVLNAGHPDLPIDAKLPFCVYAALALPIPFQHLQICVDGTPIAHPDQSALLPNVVFAQNKDSDLSVNGIATSTDLVLSRVSIVVDETRKVPILFPRCLSTSQPS
eukprot:TRINITY_DN77931_c0_g1_i1.p1 TRINITY_DN77931_c0_g1~~TRINITY_DN77931_c0_g1_i1.p1  ORF type:complete len:305 (-),score=27.40 TRINITY_DN77931_c0_g1_i1:134-1048(-)